MTYVLALLAAVVGAALGFGIGAIAGTLLAPALGISSFEGAAGYFVMFVCGPVGGLIGLIGAATWVLHRRGHRTFGAIAGRLGLIGLVIVGLTAGGLGLLYMSGDILNPNGAPPQLLFEIKLPPNDEPPSAAGTLEINLDTPKNRMPGSWSADKVRHENGRAVISGRVELYYRTSARMLVMKLPNKQDIIFQLKLAASAKHSDELGPWYPANFVSEPGQERPRKATAAESYEVRNRVSWPGQN